MPFHVVSWLRHFHDWDFFLHWIEVMFYVQGMTWVTFLLGSPNRVFFPICHMQLCYRNRLTRHWKLLSATYFSEENRVQNTYNINGTEKRLNISFYILFNIVIWAFKTFSPLVSFFQQLTKQERKEGSIGVDRGARTWEEGRREAKSFSRLLLSSLTHFAYLCVQRQTVSFFPRLCTTCVRKSRAFAWG